MPPSGHVSPYPQKMRALPVCGRKAIGCSPHPRQYNRAAVLQNKYFFKRRKGHPLVKKSKGLPRTQFISQNDCLKNSGRAFVKCLNCVPDLCLHLQLEIIKFSHHSSAVLSCVFSLTTLLPCPYRAPISLMTPPPPTVSYSSGFQTYIFTLGGGGELAQCLEEILSK